MRNLEAKFRLRDLRLARERAEAIGYTYRADLHQRDTFFRVRHGKLKLREEAGSPACLIHYGREERDALQLSNYEIAQVADGEKTHAMFSAALGVIAEVRKQRTLLMRDNVRLHLDRIEGLGDYGEIEAIIVEGDDPEGSRAAVDELLAALGVAHAELIEVSYFELAAQAAQPK
jgi:predicted adenylyl cyclase CyaB